MRLSIPRRQGRSSLPLVLLLTVLISAVVSVGAWYILVKKQFATSEEETRKQLLTAIGLSRPVTNGLDPKFTDADGDLVADAPKDAKEHVDPPTLKFCYVAVEEGGEEFQAAWADFMKYLSEATGKPVEYLMLSSEREQLVALQNGELHVTGLNTGRVPVAVDACGFVPVAMLADADGDGKTHTEIIVPADSTVKNVAELRGKELTLTDTGSNSGYKAPLVFLKDAGLLPERDFVMRFSGGHDASIAGIASKRYQAAAVAADVLHRAVAAGTIKPEQFRSIFKSESFPTAGIGYAYNLKPELAAKIRDAIVKFPWAGTSTEKYFANYGQKGLVPVTYKDDWSLVRRIDDAIGYQHVVK